MCVCVYVCMYVNVFVRIQRLDEKNSLTLALHIQYMNCF
jgi:hypothetical protein